MSMNVLLCSLGLLALCGFATSQQYPCDPCNPTEYQCTEDPHQPKTDDCHESITPNCDQERCEPCSQNLIQLKNIEHQLSPNTNPVCCKVLNCPMIFYSDCTYQRERCPFWYDICTPERYVRHEISLRCPCNGGYENVVVTRYLPECCSCSRCLPPKAIE